MDWKPEFWTPQILTESELNDICNWLGRWQAACITASSVTEKPIELDPNFVRAMHNVEALVRHLQGLKEAGMLQENQWEAMPPSQLAGFHDAVFDVTGKSPSKNDMFAIWCNLPENIRSVGDEHGFSDTEFVNALCKWLKDQQ
jgi:hypothetical protein